MVGNRRFRRDTRGCSFGMPRFRLQHELLENRLMLASSLIVNTAEDIVDGDVSSIAALLENHGTDGSISLREAILASNATVGANTIFFDSSLDGIPIHLTRLRVNEDAAMRGDLDITDDLKILGNGPESTVIDGESPRHSFRLDRVIDIISGTVVISDITIRNGEQEHGGGIRNRGELSLINSVLELNHGGGIFNDGGVISLISGSTISGNQPARNLEANRRGNGGGINNVGGIIETISHSDTSDNLANKGGGINNVQGGKILSIFDTSINGNEAYLGGGINSEVQGVIDSISQSKISGNSSVSGGMAINNHSSTIGKISNSTITENFIKPSGTFDGNTRGGGIANLEDGYIGSISDSLISENLADEGAGIYNRGEINHLSHLTISNNITRYGNGDGGGIKNRGRISNLSSSTVFGNEARIGGGIRNGGVIESISQSTISGNIANERGGGIYNRRMIGNISNSTIAGNQAVVDSGGIFNFGEENNLATIDELVSNIIAENIANSFFDLHDHGAIYLINHNLIEDSGGHSILDMVDGNLVGVNPKLGPLADNGGPTLTHALLPGSPAIGAGTNSVAKSFDQRGTPFLRDVGSAQDIGAFEFQHVYAVGDANRDGKFDVADIIEVLTHNKFNSKKPAVWEEGDWNGNGRFDVYDILLALTEGDFQGEEEPESAVLIEEIKYQSFSGIEKSFDDYHCKQGDSLIEAPISVQKRLE